MWLSRAFGRTSSRITHRQRSSTNASVFGDHVVRLYPVRVFPDASRGRSRLGIRDRDPIHACDFSSTRKSPGNTPVHQASSVKSIHVDLNTNCFQVCCTCARPATIRSAEISTYSRLRRDLTDAQRRRRFDGMFIDDDLVEQVMRVPYRRNTLFMFVNGPLAARGDGAATDAAPALFLNLVGETRVKLFDVPMYAGSASQSCRG